jgi:isopentenyl diphosphate isomerase/L-lactate dehydrogenase-like FMN-dependent dehydrogenase
MTYRFTSSRRAFLRFVASSPLIGAFGLTSCDDDDDRLADATLAGPIRSPEDAINVFDFEAAAQATVPTAHFGYMATGVDDDLTLRANREGFSHLYLRPRRLVDVSTVDMSVDLFGERWDTPIVLCPAGSQKAFHPEGELAVARAARTRDHLQILSTVSTTPVEEVAEARDRPIWYQRYPTTDWNVTRGLLARAEGAGCPVVVLTVDLPVGSNRNTERRYAVADDRDCATCHTPTVEGYFSRKRMFDSVDVSNLTGLFAPSLTWAFVRRLKDTTGMRVVIKGIVTGEDAARCVEYGADGIIVSNHGGRAEESGRATILSLSEVVSAVKGRIPVIVDSGFRRGNDVLKALALGATAVGIGRPYLWGLGAFGQTGVERVLDILRGELHIAMQLAGTPTIADVGPSLVGAS